MTNLDNRIRANSIKTSSGSTSESQQAAPLSIYIYIAGLVVSLSGMYAATYDMADTNFGFILRSLVVCGYCVSYWLRRNRIDLKQYQAPLLVVFATVMYFVASTAPELSSSTSSNGMARPYQIQVVIIWIAVLQSFTLCTDSAILFACVPSMALIGIMSSGSPDTEVQYAFFVFLASATFLMVHENHLRTRTAMAQRSRANVPLDNRLFRGELVLVGCCIAGTMLLASVIAAPIEIVGKALIPPNPQYAAKAAQNKQTSSTATIQVDEDNSIDLAMGPSSESDVPLLSVSSVDPIPYIRGTTYDYYDGLRFQNQIPNDEGEEIRPVVGRRERRHVEQGSQPQNEFDLDPYTLDPGTGRMNGAVEVGQDVRVLGGTITHLYGAPVFKTVYSDFDNLLFSKAGAVYARTPMVQGQGKYHITSLVPSSNPNALKRSSTDYPASIVPRYLQVTNRDTPPNPRLSRFAQECTKGLTNPFDKVIALRDAIANRCNYNLQAPAIPRDRDVVEAFLFEFKQGKCDSFAPALTVLCRYVNVPSRLASGFIRGDRDGDSNTYTFKDKHRHAWTEVYFTDIGWVPFDATDNAHDVTPSTSTTDRSIATPIRWITSHGVGPPAIALLIVILIIYLIKTEVLGRFRRNRAVSGEYEALPLSNTEIIHIYQKACLALASSGIARPSHLTPAEFRTGVKDRLPATSDAGALLDSLTNLHQTFAYGRLQATDADVSAARTALSKLNAAVALLPRARPDR